MRSVVFQMRLGFAGEGTAVRHSKQNQRFGWDFWMAKSMPETVAASPPVAFVVSPESAAAQETDNQPEPAPASHSNFDAETIAELKRKLREAIAVANGCRALHREDIMIMIINNRPTIKANQLQVRIKANQLQVRVRKVEDGEKIIRQN